MAVYLKNESHIEHMRKAGKIVSTVLSALSFYIKPGVTTKSIDEIAEKMIKDLGGTAACKGYTHGILPPYPGAICISINEEAVHCFGTERIIKDGDVVKIDIVVDYKGWKADSARTYLVDPIKPEIQALTEMCYLGMWAGIKQTQDGKRVNDIGKAIENFVGNRYGIVKEFIGHGIGKNIHEDPRIPNYYTKEDTLLCEGMVICVEPILTFSIDPSVEVNGWFTKSKTGANVVHFEHSCLITSGKPEILTLREEEIQYLPNLLQK